MSAYPEYGPIQAEMPLVEGSLRGALSVEYPWLVALLEHVLQHAGKRIRPALILLAGRFHRYDLDLLVPMAAAAELLHTGTLVHDDTIDKALVRRGHPTVNSVWNDSTAVLLGDYLFANAAELVSRTQNVRVMRLFAVTLMTICSGEMAQDFAAFDWRQGREQYLRRIERKTASLFAMATESGAVLSGAPEEQVQALREYGYHLGTAFQIADDILDFTGDEEELGKPVGSDLLQGTLTLPSLLLMERYPQDNPIQNLFLERAGSTKPALSLPKGLPRADGAMLQRAIEMVRNSSILAECRAIAQEYGARARAALEALPDEPARRTLAALTEQVVARRR